MLEPFLEVILSAYLIKIWASNYKLQFTKLSLTLAFVRIESVWLKANLYFDNKGRQ